MKNKTISSESEATQDLKIETGVPRPFKKTENYRGLMKRMSVDDSFLIPLAQKTPTSRNCIYGAAKSTGIKVSVRSVDGGLRVWRIK